MEKKTMAHIKQVQGQQFEFIYNVDMAVGSQTQKKTGFDPENGGPKDYYKSSPMPNKRDDVMLVQYLLRRIYQKATLRQPPLNPKAGVSQPFLISEIKVDGCCGPKTQAAITHFQMESARRGNSIAVDGCVDSARTESLYSTISKTGYTIAYLNSAFFKVYSPGYILSDPECPAELKQSLLSSGLSA
jgi:peptidoglycan hydrolase-like protein with peptidoglycan-binding domain